MATQNIVDKNKKVSETYQQVNTSATSNEATLDNGNTATAYQPTVFDDAIYKAQKEQNYKDYYNTQVQNYIASENAKKYLSNELANRGLNTQGYGSSAQIGVNSAYQNARSSATQAYQQANLQTDLAQNEAQQALATENDNQLVTYLTQGASTVEQADQFMKNYGYSKNENGIWVDANGNAANSYIVSAYDNAVNNLNSENDKGVDMATLRTLGIDPRNSDTNYDSAIGWELNTIEKLVNKGEVNDGKVFKCVSGNGKGTAYIMYKGGKYYIVNESDYENAKEKEELSHKK